MAKKIKREKKAVEWIGGIVEVPVKIQEPKADSSEIILWMSEDGRVVGQDVHLQGN